MRRLAFGDMERVPSARRENLRPDCTPGRLEVRGKIAEKHAVRVHGFAQKYNNRVLGDCRFSESAGQSPKPTS